MISPWYRSRSLWLPLARFAVTVAVLVALASLS